jgi:hypothetical protein
MNITGAEINWVDGYANSPGLYVTTDGPIPRREDLRYRDVTITTEGGSLSREQEAFSGTYKQTIRVFYAEHESGYVSFIKVGGMSGGASGGDFTMEDGSVERVRSGWTISSTAIREIADVIECGFYSDPRYRTAQAGFIVAERAREIVAEFLPAVEMFDDGTGWTFKWRGAPSKSEWQAAEHERYMADLSYERRPYSRWLEYAGSAA